MSAKPGSMIIKHPPNEPLLLFNLYKETNSYGDVTRMMEADFGETVNTGG